MEIKKSKEHNFLGKVNFDTSNLGGGLVIAFQIYQDHSSFTYLPHLAIFYNFPCVNTKNDRHKKDLH